ncbi:hypothetical protein J6590_046101 [Homalodisca vitripennis]|nr:hypothetical protein J6590_046101 [Homalodisca vitripennis]
MIIIELIKLTRTKSISTVTKHGVAGPPPCPTPASPPSPSRPPKVTSKSKKDKDQNQRKKKLSKQEQQERNVKMATATGEGSLRELSHPSLNDQLKNHNAVTFKLVRTGK